MGEIRVEAKFENYGDLVLRERSKRRRRKVRTVTLACVADTGAVHTLLPQEAAEALGLVAAEQMTVVLANDQKIALPRAYGLMLTVAGRTMTTDCLIGPPGCAALIGQIVMEALDLIADPRQRTLTVRPESPLRPTIAMRAAYA
jgi:predicted aspartyl protease